MSECRAMIAVESQEAVEWWENVQKKLAEPFPEESFSWRVQRSGVTKDGKPWLIVMPYIDARDVQNRLDDAVGAGNWENVIDRSYSGMSSNGSQIAFLQGIKITNPISGRSVTKWDGCREDTPKDSDQDAIDPIKGAASDSIKRAAVLWGIGRHIYGLGDSFAEVVERNGKYTNKIKDMPPGKQQVHWNPPGKKSSSKPSPTADGPSKPSTSSSEAETPLLQMQKFCQSIGAKGPEDINLVLMAIAPIGKPAQTWAEFKETSADDQMLVITEAKSWAKSVFDAEKEKIGQPSNLVGWLKKGAEEVPA